MRVAEGGGGDVHHEAPIMSDSSRVELPVIQDGPRITEFVNVCSMSSAGSVVN